jgi:DNA polymerase elongation subunit (family B)
VLTTTAPASGIARRRNARDTAAKARTRQEYIATFVTGSILRRCRLSKEVRGRALTMQHFLHNAESLTLAG